MNCIESKTGRAYQVVKIWDENGKYMDQLNGLRRYRLVKRYV